MLGRFIKNWINIISNSQYVSIGLAIAEELLWDEAAGEAPFFGVWLGLASPPWRVPKPSEAGKQVSTLLGVG